MKPTKGCEEALDAALKSGKIRARMTMEILDENNKVIGTEDFGFVPKDRETAVEKIVCFAMTKAGTVTLSFGGAQFTYTALRVLEARYLNAESDSIITQMRLSALKERQSRVVTAGGGPNGLVAP